MLDFPSPGPTRYQPLKWVSGVGIACGLLVAFTRLPPASAQEWRSLVGEYCLDCHDSALNKGDLDLETVLAEDPARHWPLWEKVIRRVRARQMPPPGKDRPDEAGYHSLLEPLETRLDQHFGEHPRPGRPDTFRRLTRFEYQNAIRDLLDLEVDATQWLPKDSESHGFDNVTVADLSPTLLNRYITAAQRIARLAVGASVTSPEGTTIRLKPDLTQEERMPGLPLGTRGGALIRHTFPRNGKYEVVVRLTRDRNEHVEGLSEPHQLEILLDRERLGLLTVKPPRGKSLHQDVDQHLTSRFAVTAGPHDLGVTFIKKPSSLEETKRQPYLAHYNFHRHPRLSPAVYEVTINGPFDPGSVGDTPSRNRIFIARPGPGVGEEDCARKILSHLMHRAFRRPIIPTDLERPMTFFREAQGFEAGIEAALSAILVSPNFLFRIERDPPGMKAGEVYAVNDLELASRLSFFLWSSLPDETLLETAARGELRKPEILEREAHRLLADPRAGTLATHFAGQWLHLHNLDGFTPDLRQFTDFDDNLRQGFRRETELLFEEVMREDASVLNLLRADHTYLNGRLAAHYGIPHVYGTRFQRVALGPDNHRGGLLRQGSILAVTSYATRTSPVIRGNWILENLVGTPPPPPPPNVPALEDNTVDASLPLRNRLAAHRANRACAVCHDLMDPVGFALENYDAVGRWRETEDGRPIDVSGGLPDGSEFRGAGGLERGLLARPELFAATFTEKMLTYALGRGVEYYDGPAVRRILGSAEKEDFRFSAIVVGIVKSTPFRMRQAP